MSRVKVMINGVPALLCVSNNSNINILKPKIATRAGLTVQELENPFQVTYGVGEPKQMKHKLSICNRCEDKMSRVRVMINGVPANLYFSNSSNVNVLKPEIAMRAGLSIVKLEQPFLVSCGGIFQGPPCIIQYKAAVPYQSKSFVAEDVFYLSPDFTVDIYDGIMGVEWFKKYTPTQSFGPDRSLVAKDLAGNDHALDVIPDYPRPERQDVYYIKATRLDG